MKMHRFWFLVSRCQGRPTTGKGQTPNGERRTLNVLSPKAQKLKTQNIHDGAPI
jgi:hypothetical protein